MADPHQLPSSPISQVLHSLGLTREDLLRHSDQMRQFLTAEDAMSLRVLTGELNESGSTGFPSTHTRSVSRSKSIANASSSSTTRASPAPATPLTPVKTEQVDSAVPSSLRHMDNMEMVIERKSRQHRRDRKCRKERDRNNINTSIFGSGGGVVPPSPLPSSAGFSLDSFMQSRDGRRVSTLEQSETTQNHAHEVSRAFSRGLNVVTSLLRYLTGHITRPTTYDATAS